MNYLFWEVDPGERVCRLGDIQNVEKDFQLMRGITRKEGWPEEASYYMDKERKHHIRLEDCLWNIGSLLVISLKLREFFEKENLINNEYLPVTVYNHKDRPTKEPYFILNQIGLQDCIDIDQSEYERNLIDPELFSVVDTLVLDEKKIDTNLKLFRMKHYPQLPIIRRDLVDKIVDTGFTGNDFGEIEDYET